jgi:allantoate deiminase
MVGGARAVARCDALGMAPYSDVVDGLFRAYLTPAHRAAVDRIGAWMVEAGMTVRLDQAANLIGRYEGFEPVAPALVFGSHIDSVRDAGRYDGPLGVTLAIEVVARLSGRRLPFAIEIYAFGDEEGSRFPASMLCSRAVAGTLAAEALDVSDKEGTDLATAITSFRRHPGLDPGSSFFALAKGSGTAGQARGDEYLKAKRKAADILAFIEPHIEQGPVLDSEDLAVGVVTGIAAQLRFEATVTGTADHAGTTSMTLRRDALAAAAEMVGAVESQALAAGGDVVATVGRLTVAPGAVNVVPGEVAFSIDIRSGDQARRDAVAATIAEAIQAIADRRHVTVALEQVQDLPASPCDPALMTLLDQSLARAVQPPRRLVSGAGHDTMVMAALCPTAMLFLRSPGGISHNPAERVHVEDAEIALDVLCHFVDLFEEQYASFAA